MNFTFYPLGVPFSSSFAISSSATIVAGNTPTTASLAGFALTPIGPTGSAFRTISGSVVNV